MPLFSTGFTHYESYFLILICIAIVFPNFINIFMMPFSNSVHACSFSQSILTL